MNQPMVGPTFVRVVKQTAVPVLAPHMLQLSLTHVSMILVTS